MSEIKTELLEALKEAVSMITSEYCGHPDAHGPDNPRCYAKKFLKVIQKAEHQEVSS